MLLRAFFGGKPADDNPLLWALVNDVTVLREAVLSSGCYSDIMQLFTTRPRPEHTRFAYALFAKEDQLLCSLMERVATTLPDSRAVALMYDGFILATPSPSDTTTSDLTHALNDFAQDHGITPVIKPWPAPSRIGDAVGSAPVSAPNPKRFRFACAVQGCLSLSSGVCVECQKHQCSKHAYINETGSVLSCKVCAGEPVHWYGLQASWNLAPEDAQTASDVTKLIAFETAYDDVCLVDAIRALGVHVQHTRAGPFWALKDGNAFLEPFKLKLVGSDRATLLDGGSYIVHVPTTSLGEQHFLAVKSVDGDALVFGGRGPSECDVRALAIRDDISVFRLTNSEDESGSSVVDDKMGGAKSCAKVAAVKKKPAAFQAPKRGKGKQ